MSLVQLKRHPNVNMAVVDEQPLVVTSLRSLVPLSIIPVIRYRLSLHVILVHCFLQFVFVVALRARSLRRYTSVL